MISNNKNDYMDNFNNPLDSIRGIEESVIYLNIKHIYFKCDIDVLQDIFTDKINNLVTDALDKKVRFSDKTAVAFQLQGHHWSTMVLPFEYDDEIVNSKFLKEISSRYNLQIIELVASDYAWIIGYCIFNSGDIIEYFCGSIEGYKSFNESMIELQTNMYKINHREDEDGECFDTVYFYCMDNSIDIPVHSSMFAFPNDRFKYYDAYAPVIDLRFFFDDQNIQLGGIYQLKNPKLSVSGLHYTDITIHPKFKRVDFYTFR
jgi:hypothetical protein